MAGTGFGRSCRRRRDSASLFDEGALQRMEVAEAVKSGRVVAVAEAQERTAKQQAAGLVRACFALQNYYLTYMRYIRAHTCMSDRSWGSWDADADAANGKS